MSILNHKLWPQLKPFVEIEFAKKGDSAKPRIRIEIAALPTNLVGVALKATMPCVACKKEIHPVRARRAQSKRSNAGGFYYAPTCALKDNVACSRGKAAAKEYENVRKHFNL